jgi:uracil-DNA glycosylase
VIKPKVIIILGSIALVVLAAVVGGSIAGSYVLTLDEVHAQQATQAALIKRQMAAQEAAQLKQSRAICVTLVGLDDARIGAEFAGASHTGVPLSKSYGVRLAHAIHAVVNATKCRALLAGKLPAGRG